MTGADAPPPPPPPARDGPAVEGNGIDDLLPQVYAQLRAVAQRAMAGERADHTLQGTALVHEACLRLLGGRKVPWANRAHFYAAAAEAMRRVLIDHARARGRRKRSGPVPTAPMASVKDLASRGPDEILRFDGAFRRLEEESPDAAAVVRLRFFAGLSVDQTAEALGLSTSTVDRRWSYARAWIYRHLRPEDPDERAGAGDL